MAVKAVTLALALAVAAAAVVAVPTLSLSAAEDLLPPHHHHRHRHRAPRPYIRPPDPPGAGEVPPPSPCLNTGGPPLGRCLCWLLLLLALRAAEGAPP